MNEQQQKMLEEVVALSRENNTMVRKLVKAQRTAVIWKLSYWGVIIVASLIAYVAFQPYLTALTSIYTGGDINQALDSLPKSQ